MGPEATVAYLASDLRVVCDTSDVDYRTLTLTLTLPLPLPLTLTLTLTLTSSRGCRFLWAEYKEGFWYFETIQQLRRLFLTGYVMLFSARSNTRLLAACTVTIARTLPLALTLTLFLTLNP